MDGHVYTLPIRVLISPDEDGFMARGLEVDLLGFGKTEEEAVEDLKRTVEAQISFASQMKDPGLIGFSAEREYFDRWDEVQRARLRGIILDEKSLKLRCHAVVMTIAAGQRKSARGARFSLDAVGCGKA